MATVNSTVTTTKPANRNYDPLKEELAAIYSSLDERGRKILLDMADDAKDQVSQGLPLEALKPKWQATIEAYKASLMMGQQPGLS